MSKTRIECIHNVFVMLPPITRCASPWEKAKKVLILKGSVLNYF